MSNDQMERFEGAWTDYRNDPTRAVPDIQEFAPPSDADDYAVRLKRLIAIDKWYRKHICDQIVAPEFYQSRFADDLELIEDVFRDDSEQTTDVPSHRYADATDHPPLYCPKCKKAAIHVDCRNGVFKCRSCSRKFELCPAKDGRVEVFGRVSKYEIIGLLGEGGFGRVWLAKDTIKKEFAALKIPHNQLQESLAQRFKEEARACNVLTEGRTRSRIPAVIDCGSDGGVNYIAFEFIKARTLTDIRSSNGIEPVRAAKICHEVAVTLQLAHDHNIIHRDVKPSNILIEQDDWPYLTDFGISKVSNQNWQEQMDRAATQGFIGTFDYASPEHSSNNVTAMSDVYSLGVILFELIAGQLPFPGTNRVETYYQKTTDPDLEAPLLSSVRPGIAPRLDSICAKCLRKAPEERFQSAGALADELARFLAPEQYDPKKADRVPVSGTTRPPVDSPVIRPSRHSTNSDHSSQSRIQWVPILVGVGLSMIVLITVLVLTSSKPNDEEHHQAEPGPRDWNYFLKNNIIRPHRDPSRIQVVLDNQQGINSELPSLVAAIKERDTVTRVDINLRQTDTNDDGLRALSALGGLVFELLLNCGDKPNYSQAGVAHLQRLTKLQQLEISGRRITNLEFTKDMRLTYLALHYTSVKSLDAVKGTVLDTCILADNQKLDFESLQRLLKKALSLRVFGLNVSATGTTSFADLRNVAAINATIKEVMLPDSLHNRLGELCSEFPAAKFYDMNHESLAVPGFLVTKRGQQVIISYDGRSKSVDFAQIPKSYANVPLQLDFHSFRLSSSDIEKLRLETLKGLTRLDIANTPVDSATLTRVIQECTSLRSLDVADPGNISESRVTVFHSENSKVKVLAFWSQEATPRMVAFIIDGRDRDLTDETLGNEWSGRVARCNDLSMVRQVRITKSHGLTTRSLNFIKQLKSLRILEINNASSLDLNALPEFQLKQNQHFEHLILQSVARLGSKDLPSLWTNAKGEISNLTMINLARNPAVDLKQVFTKYRNSPRVKDLIAEGTSVTREAMEMLPNWPELKFVSLKSTQLTDDQLDSFCRRAATIAHRLEELNIADNRQLTTLKPLALLKSLRTLRVPARCLAGESGKENRNVLRSIATLKNIDLTGTDIADKERSAIMAELKGNRIPCD